MAWLARTEDELAVACQQVKAAASTLLDLQPATWRHLHGWTSTLPLGHDALGLRRTMDTQALAAAFPLASPDLPAPLPGESPGEGGVPLRRQPGVAGCGVVGPVRPRQLQRRRPGPLRR